MNKCDRKDADSDVFYELGFDLVIPISAAHQEGFFEILELLESLEKDEVSDKTGEEFSSLPESFDTVQYYY